MAKFMIQARYTADGTGGLMKEGGSARRAVAKKVVEDLGGKLEAFYFAFGDADAVVICEVPDVVSALALSMAVNASGQVHIKTTPLDQSLRRSTRPATRRCSTRAPGK